MKLDDGKTGGGRALLLRLVQTWRQMVDTSLPAGVYPGYLHFGFDPLSTLLMYDTASQPTIYRMDFWMTTIEVEYTVDAYVLQEVGFEDDSIASLFGNTVIEKRSFTGTTRGSLAASMLLEPIMRWMSGGL